MKGANLKYLIIAFVSVYLTAFLGGIFTSSTTQTDWYYSIRPSITPPSFVFPIVWNILFFLIALSLYKIMITKAKKDIKNKCYILFAINFILNILWSVFFFGFKNPLIALIEIVPLWISIFFMIKITYKVNKKASYLLIPYIIWISFAILLNTLSVF